MAENIKNPYPEIRILILEDQFETRVLIRRLLAQIGFRLIHQGESGVDGFRELLRVKPDVILCDIHMASMDGMTFLRKLRGISAREFSEIPVIFLTSDRQSATVENAVGLRVDGYLAKPVSLTALKGHLDAVLFA